MKAVLWRVCMFTSGWGGVRGVFPFDENKTEKRPECSLMSKLPSKSISITTAFLDRYPNDLGQKLWWADGRAVWHCSSAKKEKREEREREQTFSSFLSLIDDVNWYLNSVLFRNINITKEKDFTTRAIYLLWLMLSAKKKKMNASEHPAAQPPEDEAKRCPWSLWPFSLVRGLVRFIFWLSTKEENTDRVLEVKDN